MSVFTTELTKAKDRAVGIYQDIGDDTALKEIISMEELLEQDSVYCDCVECHRWDGESNRCNCGNRRVCWYWNSQQKLWESEVW